MEKGENKPWKIGMVGVGRMGSNMALRLHDAGYRVSIVHDVRPDAAQQVARQTGASVARTLADVTAQSEVILTVVGTDREMETLFAESGDSLLVGASGRIFVNCATLTPDVHVEVERRANARGADSIEASMASSITQAREGTLYLMVGGKKEVFERVRPLLESMSAQLRWIGPAGQAARLKALVNMVMNINTAGLAEGLGLADALGLDLAMVREVFSQTGGPPVSSKPTVRTCRTGSTMSIFRRPTPPRIPISRLNLLPGPGWICRWPKRRPGSSTGWSPWVWGRSTNRVFPN